MQRLSTILVAALLVACAGAPPTRVHRMEEGYAAVEANGLRIAYFAAGDPKDPLVVLLHGFPDTPHAWDGMRAELARAGYFVVSPFLRGYAPSEIPGGDDYSAEAIGRDVLGLIAALGKRDADVVGHDWGALAAHAAVALEPEKVRRLVTLAIPNPGTLKLKLRYVRRARHFLALKRRGAPRRFAADDYAGVDELYARWSPT